MKIVILLIIAVSFCDVFESNIFNNNENTTVKYYISIYPKSNNSITSIITSPNKILLEQIIYPNNETIMHINTDYKYRFITKDNTTEIIMIYQTINNFSSWYATKNLDYQEKRKEYEKYVSYREILEYIFAGAMLLLFVIQFVFLFLVCVVDIIDAIVTGERLRNRQNTQNV